MTDDLVHRLRSPNCDGCDVEEAADRIEQLEAALREIEDALESPNKGHELTDIEYAKCRARAALGEKKDA